MYKDTITLFNRKPGNAKTGDSWHPTVIKNVNLNIDRAAIMAKYGQESKDGASLFVRYKQDGKKKRIAGKEWVPPKQWNGDPGTMTFSTEGDFFWLGEWTGGITNDSDYNSESFYGYMNRTRDYVFAISAVGGPYSVIPKFEIMGK